MRPLSGVVVARDTIELETGVTVTATIPKGIKRYDPVLVCYDFTRGCVTSVGPDVPADEEVAECHFHSEAPMEPVCDGEIDDIVETDGSGLS